MKSQVWRSQLTNVLKKNTWAFLPFSKRNKEQRSLLAIKIQWKNNWTKRAVSTAQSWNKHWKKYTFFCFKDLWKNINTHEHGSNNQLNFEFLFICAPLFAVYGQILLTWKNLITVSIKIRENNWYRHSLFSFKSVQLAMQEKLSSIKW